MKKLLPFITVLLAATACKNAGPMLEIRGHISGEFDGS